MRKLRKKKPIVGWRVTGWDSFFSFIIFASTKHRAKKIYEKLGFGSMGSTIVR